MHKARKFVHIQIQNKSLETEQNKTNFYLCVSYYYYLFPSILDEQTDDVRYTSGTETYGVKGKKGLHSLLDTFRKH